MSYNGSGTFEINSAGQPVVTGTVISSTAFNALTADLATGLSTALTKDGQTTPTANLPMGTFKFTGLSAGSAATDSANIAQVQNSFGSFLTVSGTDTITATVSPSLTAYTAGQMFAFVAANTNTGAVTINISSLGAKAITKNGTTALSSGDINANYLFVIVYDGTQFQVVGVSATTFTNLTISGVLTLSGAGTQLNSTGTGAWKFPNGTTGQRPGTPAVGMTRYNSTLDQLETYVTAGWQQITSLLYSANYLVVAGGGGGGGYNNGGGGGAGGQLSGITSFNSGSSYSITVGAGGAGGNTSTGKGATGSNSVISTLLTAFGGGGGGGFDGGGGGTAGLSGGSGGGGGLPSAAGGSGTSGQGNAGGTAVALAAGGGGGSTAVGANGVTTTGGAGGAGTANSISGSSVTYSGGGGGSGQTAGGAGGSGGGGAGNVASSGVSGTANTGGGGGGVYGGASNSGGAGGSGIVVISYAGAQRGTGGTVTSSGGNTIHTFTSSGTYTA